tara:strand:+ start:71874 stop:73760 length:1887 start_codon:yes stop_codon:yes gene_type:complete
LADIKIMQPDSTPLISANVLRAASAGTAQARQTDASSRTLEAEVTAVRPTRDGWNLTLRSAGQEFQVKSEYPLPRETRVQLALTEGKAGVELQVKSITLPSGANTGGSLHNEANAALLRPLLQQFLASRVPLLPATTNTATAGAAAESLYSARGYSTAPPASGSAAIPQPSAMHQLLAALKGGQQAASESSARMPASPGIAAGTNSAAAPDGVRQLIDNWVSQLPDGEQLGQQQTLVRQVRQSGLSYEHQLMRLAEQIRGGQQSLAQAMSSSTAARSAGGRTPGGSMAAANAPGQTGTDALSGTQSGTSAEKGAASGRQAGTSSGPATDSASRPASAGRELADMFRNLWLKAAPTVNRPRTDNASASTGPSATTGTGLSRAAQANAALQSHVRLQGFQQAPGPDSLKAALEQTRAGLEASHITPQTETDLQVHRLLSGDHKAVLARALLQWLNQLRPEGTAPLRELPVTQPPSTDTPEAFRLLQTALAQTENEQVARLQSGNDNLMNIPLFFRQGEQLREIQLQIRREEEEQTDQQQKKAVRWQLRLHFELEKLGNMDVELSLSLPRLEATFWSEQADTLRLLNHRLTPLRQRLQAMGVEVSELQARHGSLPPMSRNQVRQYLVDTHE